MNQNSQDTMDRAAQKTKELRKQVQETEVLLAKLKKELATAEKEVVGGERNRVGEGRWPLRGEEYRRYGRQMIVPSVGIQGQLRLKNAKVLVVGAGGLGCPALAYLSGAGIGTIGIVDGDVVEVSNLHRQVLHSTSTIGMKKVDSAVLYMQSLNPDVEYKSYPTHLLPENSHQIMQDYDLVLDCTDNPATRYLISDTSVLLNIPLISASALRTEGQLAVLNHPRVLPDGQRVKGPCYRCVFPKPPPAESVTSCGEGGILGPVVGIMGVLQALKAVEIITKGQLKTRVKGIDGIEMVDGGGNAEPSMLLFSAMDGGQMFRTVRLKGKRKDCWACGEAPGLTKEGLEEGGVDYITFCGLKSPIRILEPSERVSAQQYASVKKGGKKHLLVDVRDKVQFDIANLGGSIHVPMSKFRNGEQIQVDWIPNDLPKDAPIYVVCRLGNDSQIVARKLLEAGLGNERWVGDILGGFKAWREDVDREWPEY